MLCSAIAGEIVKEAIDRNNRVVIELPTIQ
jgi:hypothetical protein